MQSNNVFVSGPDAPVVSGTGLIALDIVITDDSKQTPRLWAGGTCGNVLTILSYLGWAAFPIARFDRSQFTERVRTDLTRWGVHLDYARLAPAASVPIIVHRIRRRNGAAQHHFYLRCPACGAWLPTYRPVTVSSARDVAAGSWSPQVFFMDRVSRGALVLAQAAAARGALVVFEPSRIDNPGLFGEAVKVAHVVKYARERISGLGDLGDLEPLLEIETLGSNGLNYKSRIARHGVGTWRHMEAYHVPSVTDAAGSGDWCTAGVIHRLGRTGLWGLQNSSRRELEGALNLGQALAAWNCRFEGARGGMYSADAAAFSTRVSEVMNGNWPEAPSPRALDEELDRPLRAMCGNCGELDALAANVLG